MSELAYAAKLSDIDITSLSNALKKMQVSLSEAGSGAKEPREALAALGLTIRDLKALSPDRQFELIGDRINRLKDPADRARAAVELFGKAGADLLPLFEQGAEGIRKAREEAERLGASFSDEQIKRLAKADDAVKRLHASWEGFWTAAVSKGAPAISGLLGILHGELPEAPLENQLANINYQMSFLAGSTSERAIKRLRELQSQKAIVQQKINPIDDFASRRSRALSSVAVPTPGFVDKSGLDKEAKEYKSFSEQIIDYAEDANSIVRREFQQQVDDTIQGFEDQAAAAERRDRYFQEGLEKWKKLSNDTTQSMSEFAKRAAENMQDAFANFLFDPFKDGLKGLLKSFIDTIRRMVAELAAAKFFKYLGGLSGSGGFAGFLGNLFGGFKAQGGPLQQGKWYVAGEKGPEPIWGGGPGAFASGYGKGGGGSVQVNYNIDARGASVDLVKALPSILKQHGEALKADLLMGISRGRYAV
jgi:hypothetical protein